MKKILLSTSLLLTILFSSCGVNTSMIGNLNTSITNVDLTRKNFNVIEKVTGESNNTYVLGIGGLTNKSMVEKAKSQMMENANLKGGAKAVINITYDTHLTFVYPLFYKKTVTASGYVVEFTD